MEKARLPGGPREVSVEASSGTVAASGTSTKLEVVEMAKLVFLDIPTSDFVSSLIGSKVMLRSSLWLVGVSS